MRIAIIGTGNVGTHLHNAFRQSGHDADLYEARTFSGLNGDYDFGIICVKDDAIESVAAKIKRNGIILVHTSGSKSKDILSSASDRHGVIYPCQTFSKNRKMHYHDIPFYIEGSNPETEKSLISLAESVSKNVAKADGVKRRKIHLSAVFACNFVNHLASLSAEILKEEELPFEFLRPLLNETFEKLKEMDPHEAQTGPARRLDRNTLEIQRTLLASKPELLNIYNLLTESIIKTYSHERN